MAYVLPVALGVVAGVFLLIVFVEVFYLFYWRKRPLAYPRGNNVTVAPVNEGEAVAARERGVPEVAIDVTCAEYQIAALHQDLVEKLFPALGVSSTESAQNLMGPTRMLFTITEETKEELEGLDLDGKSQRRSRRSSRSKSMSDISLSPVGPLSPLSSPFATPLSSPDHFVTPYGTPTYSPLVTLPRSLSASPLILQTSCRIMYDSSGSPPPGPPSPTRPSFPFLTRGSSPGKSPDFSPSRRVHEMSEWGSANSSKLSSNNAAAAYYSPPRKPFAFATPPIHSKQVDSLVKTSSPLRACTYVYENGTFSPSSPSSPQFFPPLRRTPPPNGHISCHEAQDHNISPSSSPPYSTSSTASSRSPFFNRCNSPDTVISPSTTTASSSSSSSSCRPSSQRSSSALFSASSLPRPSRSPIPTDDAPSKSIFLTPDLTPTTSISAEAANLVGMLDPCIQKQQEGDGHSADGQSRGSSTHLADSLRELGNLADEAFTKLTGWRMGYQSIVAKHPPS